MVHEKNMDSGVPQTPWVWPCHCLPPTGTSQGFLLGEMRRDKPIWKHCCNYKPRLYLKGLAHSRHPLNVSLDLGPYLCSPGSLQQFPEHPRCPKLPALGPLHTAADAREALFLSHSQPQRVDDFSPLLEPGSEPLRISPAHMAASGITAPLSRPVLAPMSPAQAAGPSPPPVPRNLSFLCITLYSPSSLYHFPPPLPSLNLPMTPIVLLRVPLGA